jgi:hypothetical protein
MVADALFDVVLLKRLGLSGDGLTAVVRAHQSKHVGYRLGQGLGET